MIKKCFLIFIGIICALLVIISFPFLKENNSIIIPKKLNLKNGDLILRCGISAASYAVLLADSKTEFSHIGIISIENDIPYVIHAVPHKNPYIKKDKLLEFLNGKNASKYAIYRTNFNEIILKKVVFEAQKFYKNKCIFDTNYDLNTDTKLYCTELILKAFKNGGILLKITTNELNYGIGKHNIIFPSEFTKPPIFKRII